MACFSSLLNSIVKSWTICIPSNAGELIFMMCVIFCLWLFRLFLLLLLTGWCWFWLIRPDFVVLCHKQWSRATLSFHDIINGAFWLYFSSTSLCLPFFEHLFSDFAKVLLWVIWIELRQFPNVKLYQTFSPTTKKSIAICFIQTWHIRKLEIILSFNRISMWEYLLILVRNAGADVDDSLSSGQVLDYVSLVEIRVLWVELLGHSINHILWGQES